MDIGNNKPKDIQDIRENKPGIYKISGRTNQGYTRYPEQQTQNDICNFPQILTKETSDMSGQNRKNPCHGHSWQKYEEQEDENYES